MSTSSYLSAVNQKLLFASKLIKLISNSEGVTKDRHLSIAMAQSITAQLCQAWAWHLRDVATNYKVKDVEVINSVDDLVASLSADGKQPAESTELKQLFYSSTSWVNAMFTAHSQLPSLPVIRKAEMDVDRLPMLSLDDAFDAKKRVVEWDLLTVINWSKQTNELVERHRDMMIEF